MCEFIDTCKFYELIKGRKAQVWKTLLGAYCHAGLTGCCSRIVHYRKFGEWPKDCHSPTGELPEALFRLR